jgi:hypothetical protein
VVSFVDLIAIAKDIGFFEFYLPFVLTFAIFYGLLEKMGLFGPKSRNINLIISLVVSLYIIAFTPVGITFAQFLASFFNNVALIILTLIAFGMIIFVLFPVLGGGKPDFAKHLKWLLPIGALLALGAFISSGGLAIFPGIDLQLPGGGFGLGLSTQDLVIIGIIILTVLVIYWLTREELTPEKVKSTLEKAKERGWIKE